MISAHPQMLHVPAQVPAHCAWLQRIVSGPRSRPGPAARLQHQLIPLRHDSRRLLHVSERPETGLGALQNLHAGSTSLTGVWTKDKSLSSPMDEACDMVQLPWVLRKALLLLNKLELEDTDEHFRTKLKAGGVLDLVETYPKSGEVRQHSRRDKRRGHHTGRVELTPQGHAIKVEWDNPFGGQCTDLFELSEDGQTMTQTTDMYIKDSSRRCTYKTVYRRARQ